MKVTGILGLSLTLLSLFAIYRRNLLFPLLAFVIYLSSFSLFWWAASVTRGKLAPCGQNLTARYVIACGPYRYLRHPFYTAYDLAWLAGFVATGWWPLGLAAVVMFLLYDQVIGEEEQLLLDGPLGLEYGTYRQHTGRYFPRLRKGMLTLPLPSAAQAALAKTRKTS